MAYLAQSTYEDIRREPQRITYYFDRLKNTFASDLNIPGLSEDLLKAAFCSVVSQGMASYGVYTQPTINLDDLLSADFLTCASYMHLTWKLLEKFGPLTLNMTTLGWDDGAVGNHVQLLVTDGVNKLMLDPTIGLIVNEVTFLGLVGGEKYLSYKSFFPGGALSSFNSKVITAIANGLYAPEDVIYKFDSLDQLWNHYHDGLHAGVDFIDAGNQHFFIGGLYDDRIQLAGLNDISFGGKGNDTMYLGGGDDIGYGGKGADKLFGGPGKDIIYGNDGNDALYGQGGDDSIFGGNGRDWLVGNAGADRLRGDSGADIFRFQSTNDSGLVSSRADMIIDYLKAEGDKIDLSALDANLLIGGDQAFQFIGKDNFSFPGQIRYFNTGGETKIICNLDQNYNTFEFLIRLIGSHDINQNDFIL